MRQVNRRATLALCAAALLATATGAGHAQTDDYPNKPIRIIVPYTPGGFNDTLARTVANQLQQDWGQSVVVDNKPGGNTVIGTQAAASAPADGYTIYIAPFAFAVNESIFKSLPYSMKDFAPITIAGTTPNLLVVGPALPVNSLQELIAKAKAEPGKLNYASTGVGSSNHLSMERLKQMAGIDITHIPYKGSAPAVTDLMGGQVGVMFDNIPNVMQHIKAGRLKALAVTSAKPSEHAPGVPTVSEAGVPSYVVDVWFGIMAPAATPKPIIDKLNKQIVKILNQSDVKTKFAGLGVDVVGNSPAEAAKYLDETAAIWAKVVKEAGVTAE